MRFFVSLFILTGLSTAARAVYRMIEAGDLGVLALSVFGVLLPVIIIHKMMRSGAAT